jgi:hypothetical protein
VKHQAGGARRDDGQIDRGAYEVLLDSDADGMPDWWEFSFFAGITPAAPVDDPDGDGATNWEEYIADTIPTNAASHFRLATLACSSDQHEIVIPTSESRIYSLQSKSTSHTTSGWELITESLPGNGAKITIAVTNPTVTGTYRAIVEMP